MMQDTLFMGMRRDTQEVGMQVQHSVLPSSSEHAHIHSTWLSIACNSCYHVGSIGYVNAERRDGNLDVYPRTLVLPKLVGCVGLVLTMPDTGCKK